MTKIITKTSLEAGIERKQKQKDTSCPECGYPCIGTYQTRTTGFFRIKTERKYNYTCHKCSCEWNTGWKQT